MESFFVELTPQWFIIVEETLDDVYGQHELLFTSLQVDKFNFSDAHLVCSQFAKSFRREDIEIQYLHSRDLMMRISNEVYFIRYDESNQKPSTFGSYDLGPGFFDVIKGRLSPNLSKPPKQISPASTCSKCDQIVTLTEVQKSGISLLLKQFPSDFAIVSESGNSFPVHSLLLKPLWPFFDTMINSKMVESVEKQLILPYPTPCVKALVQYFYGVQFELDYVTATNLLSLGNTYDIPELQTIAKSRIMAERQGHDSAVTGWVAAYKVRDQSLRSHFAKFLSGSLSEIEGCEPASKMSEEELLQLFLDVARVKD